MSTSPDTGPPLRIAIFNDSDVVLTTLRVWFETHGHTARTASVRDLQQPHEDVRQVIDAINADVVVYDVALPFAASWDLLDVIRMGAGLDKIPFIVTTTNRAALDSAVHEDTRAFEVTGTPENLADLLALVRDAAAHRASDD